MQSSWAKFRAWDRDFGWTYRTAIFVALLFSLISAPFRIFEGGKSSGISRHDLTFRPAVSPAVGSLGRSLPSEDAEDAGEIDQRPLYPYSVIPGGAYSREELRRAVQNDPVVARHYTDFEVGKTRIIRLDHSERMYVSYRMSNQVFWTKHPLFLPAGESLLTDGKSLARTRCGNRLSVAPRAPVSPNQPRPEAMDVAPSLGRPVEALVPPERSFLLPPAALLATPTTTMMLGSPVSEGRVGDLPSPIPPLVFPVIGGGAGSPLAPPLLPPPVETPEPSTLILLITGFSLLLRLYWRRSLGPR